MLLVGGGNREAMVMVAEKESPAVVVSAEGTGAEVAVAITLADNSGNIEGRQQWWKQSQRREQATINQAAAIATTMAVMVAVNAAMVVDRSPSIAWSGLG